MNILITGGAGYVGGALTDLLADEGHSVIIYDNLMYEESYMKDRPFVFGDIRDKDKLKGYLEWADAVVWLAAIVGDGACAINPTLTEEVNQESVKWLSENFDGRIVFMSTCSVYGAQDGELTEESPTNPLSVYAATKLKAESYLKDKNAVIFRLGTLFGLGDKYSRIRLDLVVNTLTARAVSEGALTVFGGEQYRPLLHVKDAAQAIVDALGSDVTGIFNLHIQNVRILDLAESVQKQIDCSLNVVETTFEDSRNYKANSDKAKKELGFKPVNYAEYGIQEVHQLIQGGRIKDPNNPRYSNQGFLNHVN